MPSDERLTLALNALAAPRDAFRSALVTSAEQVREFLRLQRASSDNGRAARLASEFGAFAAGRIDPGRLAAVFHGAATCDPGSIAAIERALATLTALADRPPAADVVELPAGDSLHAAVGAALEDVGRAFQAVRTFEFVRARSRRPEDGGSEAAPLPYASWSRGERRVAPPLVVALDGADLHAGCLVPFLDGQQKILLVIHGASTPAPLVRCVTPDTFVLQTMDGTELDRFVAWEGPGIAAFVPETAARFTHDPAAGAAIWERLSIASLPEQAPRQSVGGLSAAQQLEELRHCQLLAMRPVSAAVASSAANGSQAPAAATDPAGQLAAWLLAQADLGDLG